MYKLKTSYDSLYLFRDTMRFGSFQKAAEEHGTTQASIAKQIAKMEEALGMVLFEPAGGGSVPTAAGLFLYDKLDVFLWDLDTIIQKAKNIPSENTMKLMLGISDMVSAGSYRPLLQFFFRNHPQVELTLVSSSPSDMRRKLVEGGLDAGITFSLGFPNDPGLDRKRLFRSAPSIYYHKDMIAARGAEVGVDSFRDCTFICLDSDVASINVIKDLPFEPKRVIFADSLRSLQLYVNAGLACAILSAAQMLHDMADICALPFSGANYTAGADIVWEKSNKNPAIWLLLDCAEKVFPQINAEDIRDPF